MFNIFYNIIDSINFKNAGGKDFTLLLWWIFVLFLIYGLYKLAQVIYQLVPKLFFVVAYGLLYYFYKVQNDKDEEGEQVISTQTSTRDSDSRIRFIPESANSSENTTVIIAVDATDKRAGGLLILPQKNLIFFYSIAWPSSLNFQEHKQPDKFEMLNAYLALQIFEDKVEAYRKEFGYRWNDLVIKCDNSFCANPDTVYLGNRNAKWRELFCIADTKLRLKPYSGRWIHEDWDDPTILMADKLSRVDCSTKSNLPKIRIGHHADHAWEIVPTLNLQFYPDHSNRNMSMKKKTTMEIYNVV